MASDGLLLYVATYVLTNQDGGTSEVSVNWRFLLTCRLTLYGDKRQGRPVLLLGQPVALVSENFLNGSPQCDTQVKIKSPCLVLGELEEDLELLEGEELPCALGGLGHDGRQDALPEGEHTLAAVHLSHAVHDPALDGRIQL